MVKPLVAELRPVLFNKIEEPPLQLLLKVLTHSTLSQSAQFCRNLKEKLPHQSEHYKNTTTNFSFYKSPHDRFLKWDSVQQQSGLGDSREIYVHFPLSGQLQLIATEKMHNFQMYTVERILNVHHVNRQEQPRAECFMHVDLRKVVSVRYGGVFRTRRYCKLQEVMSRMGTSWPVGLGGSGESGMFCRDTKEVIVYLLNMVRFKCE